MPAVPSVRRLVAVLAFLAGCSHQVQSPAVSVGAVSPSLVCNEQLTTRVRLTGDGFTPMPVDTLKPATRLVFPSVQLFRTLDLAGAAATGVATVADDPSAPASSRLHWTSEREMSFDVAPVLALAPGLHDVHVTNPDGMRAASFSGGLAAVPRPTLTAVAPDLACDAEEDRTVVLTGTGLLHVGALLPLVEVGGQTLAVAHVDGCVPVPGVHAEGAVTSCTSATFVVPKGRLAPGVYPLTLTNPAPADCVSTEAVALTIAPAPTVATIAADLICDAQEDRTLVVTGTGFLRFGALKPTVRLGPAEFVPSSLDGCSPMTGPPLAEGAVSTCTSLTVVVAKGALADGDHALVVTNPDPAGCHSLESVGLHVAPPPTLTLVAPLAICDAQGDQTLTLTGTGLLRVGAALPRVSIGSVAVTPSGVSGCVAVAGTFAEGAVQTCTAVLVTVPKSTLAAGSFPVTVRNPDPAGCASTETVPLTVDLPPVVTGVAPATVCSGGGTVRVNGQGLRAAGFVTLTAAGQAPLQSTALAANAGGTQLTATFGSAGLPGTVYDLAVDNGDGCSDPAPHRPVTVVAGPIAFLADPEVAYNGINTRVTVYATTLAQPLPAGAVTLVPAGQAAPVIQLAWTAVAGRSNRVQVVVPAGLAAGAYDLQLNDATGCQTRLASALLVTDALTVALRSVTPPFGEQASETSVTILRDTQAPPPAGAPFVATPRVFLNPTNPGPADVAIQVESVSFVDGDTLTAVVPRQQPARAYDLIVVNPDGSVGLLPSAYTVQVAPPPNIASVTPSSIVAASGQVVKIAGRNFTGSTVTLACADAQGDPVSANANTGLLTCLGASCTQQATLDGSTLPSGSLCVVRVTNADASYADYSAVGVTGASLNLPGTKAGTSLSVGRRALVAAAGNATASARFLYAIGGDGGPAAASAPFGSVEFATVDLFGKIGAWRTQRSTLRTARAFAASAVVGRYVYVAGGSDGTEPLASAERAMILSPREVPELDVEDLVPAAAGLDPGHYTYRVAATFLASDPDNPSGESLPSDAFVVRVPSFGDRRIQVVLSWTAPVDVLGTPLPNVAGYAVYRTPVADGPSGSEVRVAMVGAGTLRFVDDGSAAPGTQAPLPLGSLGRFAALPSMGTARSGLAAAIAVDPANPQKVYFYGLLGLNGSNQALATYEYLPLTLDPNGHQTVGSWTLGTQTSTQGRSQLGAWVVDSTVSSTVPAGSTYVFLGGGRLAGTSLSNKVEAGKVAAGGDLGALSDTPKDFSSSLAGYGVCAANNQLFAFGGASAGPSSGAKSASLVAPPPSLANNSWNSEGITLVDARYLMGSAVQSAFIFLVGGQTGAAAASTTTETVIW